MKVHAAGKAPRLFMLNAVASEVSKHTKQCRDEWWRIRGDTCLANLWVAMGGSGLRPAMPREAETACQIVRARYEPALGRTTLVLRDGANFLMRQIT